MKKVLAFLLTAVLVISASVCVAFAAPSAEAQGVISAVSAVDANEQAAVFRVRKIDGKVNSNFYNTLTGLKDETKNDTLKIVGHYTVEVEGESKYPLNVTFDVLGISASSDVYVLLQNGSEVVAVTPTVKDGKVTFKLEKAVEKIAIVVDGKTATTVEKENNVLSPQTSDNMVYVVMVLTVAVALLFVSKKIKA